MQKNQSQFFVDLHFIIKFLGRKNIPEFSLLSWSFLKTETQICEKWEVTTGCNEPTDGSVS